MKNILQLSEGLSEISLNILVQETVERFNYNPKCLKPSSCRLVVWKCSKCRVITEKQFRQANKYRLCLVCANGENAKKNIEQRNQKIKENWKLNGHPRLGKKHSDESKKKISENRKGVIPNFSEESLERIRTANKGKKASKETRLKMSASGKGRVFTEDHKKKISRNHADVSGKNNPMYGKPQTNSKFTLYQDVKGRVFRFRSSWESVFAQFLDNKGHNWEYECRAFPLSYIFEGNSLQGTYSPDFYLVDFDFYVEIKGYWRKQSKAKFDAFLLQYPEESIILYNKELLAEELNLYVK